MTRSIQMTVMLALVCLFTLGCQTYVNIPKQTGDAASHDPNGKTVREVLILAVHTALIDGDVKGPVQLMLPENTSSLTYAYIANALGDEVVVANEKSDQTAVAEGVVLAKGIRIRGHKAEVDIVRPTGGGTDQLVTVYLNWKTIGGWNADMVRVWHGVSIED